MRKSMLIAGLAVVGAVAATVVGTTVASAANSAPNQHFTLLTTHANGDTHHPFVIAQGPIHARGRDIAPTGSIDVMVFPKGNLRIHHHRTGKAVNTFDPVTCYGSHREHGTYRVVRGTGDYRGTTGHGTYHLRVRIIGCHQNRPPRLFMAVIKASGPLHR